MSQFSRFIRQLSRNRNGFSFVEIMISMSIGAIVMSAVYGIYSFSARTSNKGYNETVLQSDSRKLLDLIAEDLHYASSVEEFKSSRIKLKKFFKRDESQIRIYGDQNLQTITYEIFRDDGQYTIRRYEDIDWSKKITLDEVDENLFTAYIENDQITSDKAGNKVRKRTFKIFDGFMDDSQDRKKISLIRISLNGKYKNEEISLVTKIALTHVHNRNLEPDWNDGSDPW